MSVCYLTPKARPAHHGAAGRGSIAVEFIAAGEVVSAFGGRAITRDEFELLPLGQQARSIQIEEFLYLAGASDPEPADFINPSCEPNCGMRGATVLVALRDIAEGEHITYDYAMSDGSSYDEFECGCGTPTCRGRVTGDDWRRPELQARYAGYFSPYLQRRIDRLNSAG